MVPILAEQAIDRKLEMITSVITGNYEYYYGAGIILTFFDGDWNGSMQPADLMKALHDALEGKEFSDETQAFLVRIMLRYEVKEDLYDEKIMVELFETGRKKGIKKYAE
jgi:hypothetical protein